MVAKGNANRAGCDLVYYQMGNCLFMIVGILFIGISLGIGACSCDNVCDGGCNNWMGGCEKGGYDANACVNYMIANGFSCEDESCKTSGALSEGAFFALVFLGTIFWIIGCCCACGWCGCGCFAGDVEQSPVMVLASVPPPPSGGGGEKAEP